jgi:hypothetical protein
VVRRDNQVKFHIEFTNIDTFVDLAPTRRSVKRFHRAPDGQKATHVRALVFDAPMRFEHLSASGSLGSALKDGDPDVNIETAGQKITLTERISVDKDLRPVYTYKEFDVLTKPDGERIERPHANPLPNVEETLPVKITDKLFAPIDVATRFVMTRSYFLAHTDGVSYKFLFEIAKTLAEAGKFARVQAYDPVTKKPAPLVLRQGSRPYAAAFLEGRVKKDEYCLLLHLSAQELKVPAKGGAEGSEAPAGPSGAQGADSEGGDQA